MAAGTVSHVAPPVEMAPRGVNEGVIRSVVEQVEAEWSQRLGARRFNTLRSLLRELGESR